MMREILSTFAGFSNALTTRFGWQGSCIRNHHALDDLPAETHDNGSRRRDRACGVLNTVQPHRIEIIPNPPLRVSSFRGETRSAPLGDAVVGTAALAGRLAGRLSTA